MLPVRFPGELPSLLQELQNPPGISGRAGPETAEMRDPGIPDPDNRDIPVAAGRPGKKGKSLPGDPGREARDLPGAPGRPEPVFLF